MNLSRQTNLIDSEALSNVHVELYGIGSIGSWLALFLAKIGVKSITVWDYDKVEEDNVSAQAYGENQIGMMKTEALYNLIKNQTDVKIGINSTKIIKSTELDPRLDSFQYCGVDSLETRKLIFDKLVGTPAYWIDTRIGGFEQMYYFFRLDNDSRVKRYKKTLKPLPNITYELKCGEKACVGNNVMLCSAVLANITRIVNQQDYKYQYINNFLGFAAVTKK